MGKALAGWATGTEPPLKGQVLSRKGNPCRTILWGKLSHFAWEGREMGYLSKVPVHKHTEHREQTGGLRGLCAGAGLQSHWHLRCVARCLETLTFGFSFHYQSMQGLKEKEEAEGRYCSLQLRLSFQKEGPTLNSQLSQRQTSWVLPELAASSSENHDQILLLDSSSSHRAPRAKEEWWRIPMLLLSAAQASTAYSFYPTPSSWEEHWSFQLLCCQAHPWKLQRSMHSKWILWPWLKDMRHT